MKLKYIITGAVIMCLLLLVAQTFTTKQIALGSALAGNDYMSTTTGTTNPMRGTQENANGFDGVTVLKPAPGSVSQVIVHQVAAAGANGASLDFYDATTTNVNLRSATQSTTTIFKFSINSQQTVGDYTFDAVFDRGIVIVNRGGTSQASTTILYR